MSVELRPLGVKCNIGCRYCYQNPQREAGNVLQAYDLEKMKAAVADRDGGFTLFGGEPLLVPERDLEALWSWGLDRHGKNGIQTNGVLINDNHIRMFKTYRVRVGISVDGPGELNDVRWAGSLERTREATRRTHAAIERLCREGIPPNLIVTLHRGNATGDKLPVMHEWVRGLQGLGVSRMRLHILEADSDAIRLNYSLSTEENVEAFLSFLALEQELTTLRFDVFDDMRSLLLGADARTACVWNACDPYTTRAVQGVEGNGQRSNCGRTNRDGIDFTKAGREGFERYLALYATPQEHGGCAGCRFFLMCKGQCPGTAIGGDWRNRTEHCGVWKTLYRRLEAELIGQGHRPISVRPERQRLERTFLETWAQGRTTTIAGALSRSDVAAESPLDVVPAPVTRVCWVSDAVRERWAPRLARIADAWSAIEWLGVLSGVRRCGISVCAPADLGVRRARWAPSGLIDVLLETEDLPDRSVVVRSVVGRPADVAAFEAAWQGGDHRQMGTLLGYPPCCLDFFRTVSVDQRRIDSTWPMASATAAPIDGGPIVEVAGPPEANILWRWMGVRAVPHLPCRFDCPQTAALGRSLVAVGRTGGYGEEMDWLLEILSWPVEWSALHEIAEIKTPVLKLVARTDPTPSKHIVRRLGQTYPAEGARGVAFPYHVRRTSVLALGGCHEH